MPTSEELQSDQGFLSATPADQIHYLSSTDPDFKAAHPDDQAAYLAHVTKQPTGGETEGALDVANKAYEGPGVGSALGRLGVALPNIAKQTYHAFADEPKTDEEKKSESGLLGRVDLATKRLLVDPSTAASQHISDEARANEAKIRAAGPKTDKFGTESVDDQLRRNRNYESLGNVVSSVPFVGPLAVGLGERFGKGDYSGALTEAAGYGLAGPIAEEAMPGGSLPGAAEAGAKPFPATSAVVNAGLRGAGKIAAKALDNPEVTGTLIGAAAGHGMNSIYVASKIGRVLEKLGIDSSTVDPIRFAGMEEDAINLEKLEGETKKADKAFEAARKARAVYARSEEQGVPAPEATIKAFDKAQAAQAEAHFHRDAAQEAIRAKVKAPAQAAPAPAPEAPAVPPTDAELKTRQEKLMSDLEGKVGIEQPKPVEQNVKTPGQVQPETFPQEPTARPEVPPMNTRMQMPGGTVRQGVTPQLPALPERYQLTEGAPEVPAAPAAPKGDILPPVKPAKPGRISALKAEGGKIVDTESDLQQKIEEGLQGKAKPVALKPPGPAEKAPLGKATTNIQEAPLIAPEDLDLKGAGTREKVYTPEEAKVVPKKFEEALPKHEDVEGSPEDVSKVEEVLKDHTDQELARLGKKYGVDESEYDFAKRDDNRHRVERDDFVNDVLSKMPKEDIDNISRLSDEFRKKDTTIWSEAERNALSKAQRSRAIMQEHEGGPKSVAGGTSEAETVGTKEGAEKDTDFMAQAKANKPEGTLSEQVLEAQRLKEAAKKPVDMAKAADDYNKAESLHPVQPEKIKGTDKRAADIADAFDKMKHDPNDPAVKASYDALKKDINKQWDYATKTLGIKIEPTDEDPYGFTKGDKPAEKQLFDDVKNNKHLGVFRGGNPLQEGHPLAEVDPKTGETYNTMFRAIHDLFGHVAQGHDFSESGEESAWNAHMQMMDPVARPAMTTETRGQTSWFFNNEGVRGGKTAGQFADQKAGVLPDFAMERDAVKPKEVFDHIKGDKKPFAVLTAENPGNERLSDAENIQRNHELLQDLKDKGYNPKAVGGVNKDVEGKTEHSYFVPDITPEDAAELGKKHGQESILTQEGLHHLESGKIDPSDNKGLITGDKAKEQPYYSIVDGEPFAVPFKETQPEGVYTPGEPESDVEMARRGADVPEKTDLTGNQKTMDAEERAKVQEELAKKGQGGGAPGRATKLPTGDELIKKYGESDGDPAHTAFILADGRGVAQTGGNIHDQMLGGKTTDANPPRERFINEQGAIRMRSYGAYGDRSFNMSIPKDGITTEQLEHLQKMSPQMRTGQVYVEVADPKSMDQVRNIAYGNATPEALEKAIRDIAPIKNAKGSPTDEFGNPTVSGGAPATAAAPAKEVNLGETAEKHLTPEEREGVTKSEASTKRFMDNMEKIPEVQEFVDAAKKGAGERKWYQRSGQAFDAMAKESPEYFDQPGDRDKFVGLLASGSPQQSVAMNMREALRVWTNYVDKGRPEGAALEKLLRQPSDKGGFTLPGAKVPNAMKALAGEPMWPDISKNSAFKVPSFADNLKGVLNRVTNDGWMALFSDMKAGDIQSAHSYHPISVMTRAAAEELGWEPAEAQAAVWAFIKTLTEKGVEASEDPYEMRRYSEDFSDIIQHDPDTINLLKDMGIDHGKLVERLAKEVEPKPKPKDTSGASPTSEDSARRAFKRVEAARGKGTIPAAKTGNLFSGVEPAEDETTEFNPDQFRTQTEESPSVKVTPLSERPQKTILSVKVDGEKAGQMSMTPVPELGKDAMEISTSQLNPAFRSKGHGTEMYKQAIDYARSKGVRTLYSDNQVSIKAENVWQSLVRDGDATWDNASKRYKIKITPLGKAR
jgi:hypothetical protein